MDIRNDHNCRLINLSSRGRVEEEMAWMEKFGFIFGRVTNQEDRPIPEARVGVVEGTAPYPEIIALTDGNGEFELEGISPGNFKVEIAKERYQTQRQDVEVKRSEGSRLELVLTLLPRGD